MLFPTWANQCTDGYIGSTTSRELAYALLSLGVGVEFSLLVCLLICLIIFSLSFFFPSNFSFHTRRLGSGWKYVWLLRQARWNPRGTWKTIMTWLFVYSLSLWESCGYCILWYPDGKYPSRENHGKITMLSLLTSTTYSNWFSILG